MFYFVDAITHTSDKQCSLYYKEQQRAQEDQAVTEKNLEEFQSWPKEDQEALKQYIIERDREDYDLLKEPSFENARYNASDLFEKYGAQKVEDIVRSYTRNQNQLNAEKTAQTAAEAAGKGFWSAAGHSLATVGAGLLGSVTSPLSYARELAEGTGEYSTLDPNSVGNLPNVYSSAVRGQVASDIAGEGGSTARKLLSYGYQGIMSAADSLARAYVGGGSKMISLGLAATGSFGQTMSEASAQGASPTEAVALATVNSFLEVGTEYLPLEKLLNTAKGGAQGLKAAITSALKQAGSEVIEEEVNLIGSVIAEAAILRERSSYNQQIGELVANGMSYKEARDKADKALVEEAVQTALVSGFSGGASSLGASAFAGLAAKPETAQQAQEAAQTAKTEDAGPAEVFADTIQQAKQQAETEQADQKARAEELAKVFVDTADGTFQKPESSRERGIRYQASKINTAILSMVERVKSGAFKANDKVQLGKVSDSNAAQIQRETGIDVRGYDVAIEARQIDHILKDHGENGAANQSMANPEDIARIEYALNDPDRITKSRPTKAYVTNKDGKMKPADTVLYEKLLEDGSYYVVQAVPETKKKTLYILTAFIGESGYKNTEAPQITNVNGPGATPQADSADTLRAEQSTNADHIRETPNGEPAKASTNSITQSGQDVNGESGAEDHRSVGAAASRDIKQSKTFTNSGLRNANENVRQGYRENLERNPNAAEYEVKHNADVLRTAQERTATPEMISAEYEDLMGRDMWTPEDIATSTILLDKIMASGEQNASEMLDALREKRKNIGVGLGQRTQAFSIQTMTDSKSPASAVNAFHTRLNSMRQEDTTYNAKKAGVDFDTWKRNIQEQVDNIGIAIAKVEDGDSAQMRDIIRQIAKERNTTAWFGSSSRLSADAQWILNKLDFDTLKTVANTQIAAMADDFRSRSKGEIISGIRKQSMLTSLKTVGRNLAGNAVTGIADALSDSGAGHMVDAMLSKITGRQTVGNDVRYTREYLTAAKESGKFASLCVELNVPIETDAESSYASAVKNAGDGKYVGKTFRANGNVAMRAMYAYQKYMSYALEVSDKIFEGGTNAAVKASLEALKSSGLSQEEVGSLSEFTANRRTFKDATWEGTDGKTHGSNLSRGTSAVKKALGTFGPVGDAVGDVAIPFAKVPMNVAQTGIDYSAGIVKGAAEIVSIIKDAKAGKEIDVARQRQAVSDFGRGVSGTGMIALFTAMATFGVLRSSEDDDRDKESLAQSEGRSGAQINWDAIVRGLQGGSTEWRGTDTISSFDFLEPFNTQMYLGYELAQEESVLDMLKAYPGATMKSVWSSLMDSPAMTGLSEIKELVQDISGAEDFEEGVNAVAGYGGDVVSSFIPQIVRQTAQEIDPYYRDTSGASTGEAALNKIVASLPWLSRTLPEKYNGLGEVQMRDGFVSTFLDPTNTRKYQPNEITGYLDTLSETTGDKAIYPDRKAPDSITVGDKEIQLSGTELAATYQKTYGENISALYGNLIGSADFESLTEDMKVDVLKQAKEYAKEFATASVSDYSDVQSGSPKEIAAGIIQKVVSSEISGAFSSLSKAWKNEWDDSDAVKTLDEAYDVYKDLRLSQRWQIKEDASGRMACYLDARESGVDTETFADLYKTYADISDGDGTASAKANEWAYQLQKAKQQGQITQAQLNVLKSGLTISSGFTVETEKFDEMTESGISADKANDLMYLLDGIEPQKGYSTVRDIQKAEAIVEKSGLTEKEKTAVLKIYLNDTQDENLDEMKGMGYTASEYYAAWKIYTDEKATGGEGTKNRTITAICDELGCDWATGKAIYEIYG